EFPLIYGQFDQSLFPTNDWRECCLKALSVMEIRNWAPDLIERDDESLIQQIRTRVLPRRGVFAMPDEIVVTNGALEALNLCLMAVARPGDVVAVEAPGFYAALQAIERLDLRAVEIPVDPRTGLDLDALANALDRHDIRACW
uniref:aminotransferase class I/II-fold pyridoxal phosphate-dependent enzyme n=1 Tax=Enterobacter agglomerans TaxID=549 RepID=UPI001CA3E2D2